MSSNDNFTFSSISNFTSFYSSSDVWEQEELYTLYWYHVQSKKFKDIIGSVMDLMKESGFKQKSRISVIQQLLQQDVISTVEFDDLMKFEDSKYETEARGSIGSPSKTESGIDMANSSEVSTVSQPDDIKVLRDRLLKENKGKFIIWLQQVLLECCFIKLNVSNDQSLLSGKNQNSSLIMEPIPHHCIRKKIFKHFRR